MVDSIDHWATVYVCNLCGKIPESGPLFHCPFQHQYCNFCFQNLKQQYQGIEEDGCFCEVCKASLIFKESKINSEFLKKLKSSPGIGRSYRYDSCPLSGTPLNNAAVEKEADPFMRPVTVENLFGLPKSDLNKLFERKKPGVTLQDKDIGLECGISHDQNSVIIRQVSRTSNYTKLSSHKPVLCPHHPCSKMISISSFTNHFRYEHPDLKKYTTERNKDILIPFDISISECEKSLCLAIVTVYETNKIDLLQSKSTHSVIKTCRKFCQKVPIDSFWIMLSSSRSRRKSQSYVLIWLFSNTGGKYNSTIELSSKTDNVSFSCFSCVNDIPENLTVNDIAKKFNCLYISYGSAAGLLREGRELNIRIIVH